MAIHLEPGVAETCRQACNQFATVLRSSNAGARFGGMEGSANQFDTARQIGTVYSLFSDEDLGTLLNGFVVQAEAMSMLFAAAGGLIEAQDEAVAAALGKAAEAPAGLQSAGLMAALAVMSVPSDTALAFAETASHAAESPDVGGYDRVGPEDVSATPLERIVTAAEALDADQFAQVQEQISVASSTLDSAASKLRSELGDILGGAWQGEFAQQGSVMSEALTRTAFELVEVLDEVASRAGGAQGGFETTRRRISSESAQFTLAQASTPGLGSGPGAALGPPTQGALEAAAAARAAAEEQARATVNTEYSPAVMKANIDDLRFPTAFQVVSGTALGGPNGIDPMAAWNISGVPQTAGAATPGPAALSAAGLGAGGTEGSGTGATRPVMPGTPITPTDAATEQALLASRTGAGDTGGLGAATGASGPGVGAGGGPVNATTTAAGAPLTPMHSASGQQTSAAADGSGIRGLRGSGGRDRDRGFRSAAGLVGGGGAAAAGAGAGASRMGGAGTLAGMGSTAGPGGGAPTTSAPGPGAGAAHGATASAGGLGQTSSSSASSGAGRPGAMPMGMMGAGAAGQGSDRRGHTAAGYLTNATNTTEIIGDPVKVAPAVLGRKPDTTATTSSEDVTAPDTPTVGRVLGHSYSGSGAERD